MKTWNPKVDEVKKNWWLVDATGYPLGRLASEVAILLRGKHKVEFTPHIDTGDFVVVINAKQIQLTGRKWTDKKYFSHSRFFGSLKEKKAKELTETELINKAVSGMLPKNKMRKKLMKKLKVYEAAEHPHKAQKPSAYTVTHVLSTKETGDIKTTIPEKSVISAKAVIPAKTNTTGSPLRASRPAKAGIQKKERT